MKLLNNEKIINYGKLIAAGFILLWLFIRSPLNPLYEDFSVSELYFVNISFAYWFALSVFLIWIIFFINRKNYIDHLNKIFGLTLLFNYLFFIPFGFEFTDTGYHLAKQFSMFHGAWKEGFDAIAGTNLSGGLWLLISGGSVVLWSRIGFVIVQFLIVYISYKILVLYFDPVKVFISGLIIGISLSLWQYYQTVNYDNLPLLFLMLSVYYMIRELRSENGGSKYYIPLSGVFLILSVFCKISYFPALFLIPLVLFKEPDKRSKMLKGYISGVAFSSVVLISFLIFTGALQSYLSGILTLFGEALSETSPAENLTLTADHSFSTLYFEYKIALTNIISSLVFLTFNILLFSYLYSRIIKDKYFKTSAYAVLIWIFYYSVFEPKASEGVITFALILSLLWLISEKAERIEKFYELMIVSFVIFIISFIGSDLGISTAFRSGSAFLPVTVSLLLISESEFNFGKILISFRYIFGLGLVIFTIFFIQDDFRPYQDFKYDLLSESFKSPQLLGIKSNPDRVAVVDSLLTYLNDIPDLKERDIYFAKHSPMYYYLTETKYRLDSPWDTLNKLEDIKADFDRQAPEMIVLPKGSHRNYMWPNEQKGWEDTEAEVKVKSYYEFYDSFIKENNYIEVYKNSFYTVYERMKDK